jgi:GT2 family glycosyltransferase
MNHHNRICIILLNWNGKKETLECLSSLSEVHYKKMQTLVVDNGSTDGSVSAIREIYPNIPILETKKNLGFAAGNNVGIEWALQKPFEWILLLNNDTVVSPNFLDAFLTASQKKKTKILGAKIYRYHDRNRIDHLGGFWNFAIAEFESSSFGKIDDKISYEKMELVDYVSGCALFMHRTVPEKIGLLEPDFFLYWEENDYCYRARKAGFEIWTAPKAHVYHKISTSFIGGKPHMHYFWWRNRLLWISRHCTPQEKRSLYKKILFPELRKYIRLYCLQSPTNFLLKKIGKANLCHSQKLRRYRAGLTGALHYFLGKFGNCPKWLLRKEE